MQRLLDHFEKAVWLNPQPPTLWPYHQSIAMAREQMEGRMYPLTLRGLDEAMRELS
jgi:hypothetical protein